MTTKMTGWLFVGLVGVAVIAGCTGQRVTTAVEGQVIPSAPSPTVSAERETRQPSGGGPPATGPLTEERRVVQEPSVTAPPSEPTPAEPAPAPSQPQVALADIYFDYDQHVIRSNAQSVLETNAVFLKARPDRTVLIEGHCDERGTSAYNLVLGERRASAAKRYLQDLGVTPSRITIVSYGKERPFCTEHSEACWQSNRRAHFRLQ
ncbi:MAG: peptidoglycan-associated lipoprotein Pal [Nitrospira sp.]|nr:peptidoglycan-associated lipoprotein Pal [Nitrospira sp.]MCP9442719.1 peptidoglycan-associated lipoprotein Pal [Nitrospira sp.]